MDFYLPVRGNRRRRSSSHGESLKENAVIEKEVTEIERNYDFDNPSAIDWEILLVSINLSF